MKLGILMSCMYEKDYTILAKSNIKNNVVVINQCDRDLKTSFSIGRANVIWIDSRERGLSRSRNMAIANADTDICLLADNDEIFDNDIENVICSAYDKIKEADIIVFRLHNKKTKLKNKIYKINKFEIQRVCSWQISFRRTKILDKGICFDVMLGAGTGNGAGEENKFLLDCYNNGLKIYHVPIYIASMIENKSTWFNGYNEDYFYKHGMVTRYIWGFGISVIYAVYYTVTKYTMYKNDISFIMALNNILKGIFGNKLGKRSNDL